MDDGGFETAAKETSRNTVEVKLKVGGFSAVSKVSVTTGGLVAIAGLVGVILSGTAGIVWIATEAARGRGKHIDHAD